MGFESGILKTAHNPVWKSQKPVTFLKYYHDGEQSPSSWMRWSIPWYSRILTQKLGMKKFQDYINKLDYGNKDLSGDEGKNNGLTLILDFHLHLKLHHYNKLSSLKNLQEMNYNFQKNLK